MNSIRTLKLEYNDDDIYKMKVIDKSLYIYYNSEKTNEEELLKQFELSKFKLIPREYALHISTNDEEAFNELFEEEIVDDRKESKSYFNFSGGERKRIDLACLFAFLDIRRMQGDVSFSTTFYDELLDSSLDDRGVELVLEVLRDRVDQFKENAYIVTHRGSAITSKVDNTICIEKKNGFSNLIEI